MTFWYTHKSVPCSATTLLQQMGKIQRPMARHQAEWGALGDSGLDGTIPLNPSLQGSRNSMEEEAESISEGLEDTGKTRPSKSAWAKLMWTQRLRQHAQVLCRYFLSFSLVLLFFYGILSACPYFLCILFGFFLCSLVSSNSPVLVFVLSYILFHYILLFSINSLFFFWWETERE